MKNFCVLFVFVCVFLLSGCSARKKTVEVDPFSFDNQYGLVKDTRTGLVWQRCSVGRTWDVQKKTCIGEPLRKTWTDMIQLASEQQYAGFNDWRLPTEKELMALLSNKKDLYYCNDYEDTLIRLFPLLDYRPNKRTSRRDLSIGSLREVKINWHWLSSTSSNYKTLIDTANLSLENGSWGICIFPGSQYAHAEQPAILVRGGSIPVEWTVALSYAHDKNLTEQSKAELEAGNRRTMGWINSVGKAVSNSAKYGASSESGGTYEYTVECTGTTFSGIPKRTYSGIINATSRDGAYESVRKYQREHSCYEKFGQGYSGEGYLKLEQK